MSLKDIFDICEGNTEKNDFVHFHLQQFGRDFVLYVGGGEEHIGAVSCSDKVRGPENWQHSLIHHKEDLVVKKVSEGLTAFVPGELLVIAGIHYDDISKEEILAVVNNCEVLIKRSIALLETEYKGQL